MKRVEKIFYSAIGIGLLFAIDEFDLATKGHEYFLSMITYIFTGDISIYLGSAEKPIWILGEFLLVAVLFSLLIGLIQSVFVKEHSLENEERQDEV